jgi:hypothetical protein
VAFPGGTYLEFLVGYIREEFEQLYALFEGYLRVEHAEDGGHTNVTAHSLTLTEDDTLSATGLVAAGGTGTHTFGGPVQVTDNAGDVRVTVGEVGTAQAAGGAAGVLLEFPNRSAGSNSTKDWALANEINSAGSAMVFYDKSGDRDAVRVRWNNTLTAYELMPDPTTKVDREVTLGSSTDASRTGYWDNIFLERFTLHGKELLTDDVEPAQITANQNDYTPGVDCSSLTLSSNGAYNITGLVGGDAGQRLRILNNSSFTLTFTHQDAASTAGNRFICPNATNVAVRSLGSIDLHYRGGRWWILGA